MAKSQQRLRARELRTQGVSVQSIAKKVGVVKSTASLWTRDIILSLAQLEQLRQQNIKGGEKGRLLGALKQKNDRLHRIQKGLESGRAMFPVLTRQELLATGTGLYWAEGTKKHREVTFCNSDPKLVKFMITWLQKCFSIPIRRLYCYVGINQIHVEREQRVKQYWSEITGIPLAQFRKTSFKKVKNHKVYENFDDHFGTLTVKVKKPAQLYYNILGLIEGLYCAKKPA
jgi:hypothetical protein